MPITSTDNRINRLFGEKKEKVLSIYFSAGFPKLNDTVTIIQSLEQAGADLIEIGIPYSDPIADGPTIQDSNTLALKNGMSIRLLFDQLKEVRQSVNIPLILMGYINPIMQFGIEKFCEKCGAVGIDGLIVPDLPIAEYIETYKPVFEKHGLLNMFLITPQTPESRIRLIDDHTDGFIYMVSSASVTGAKKEISEAQVAYFNRIKNMDLKNPRLIGFGISNHATFEQACQYASGAIIGSAFIKVLERATNLSEEIVEYVKSVKGA